MIMINYIIPWSIFDGGTDMETIHSKQVISRRAEWRPNIGDTVMFRNYTGLTNEQIDVVKGMEFIVQDIILNPMMDEMKVILFIKIADIIYKPIIN